MDGVRFSDVSKYGGRTLEQFDYDNVTRIIDAISTIHRSQQSPPLADEITEELRFIMTLDKSAWLLLLANASGYNTIAL